MKKKMAKRLTKERFRRLIVSDDYRYYFQLLCLSIILGAVSIFMGVLNAMTGKVLLMYVTFAFGVIFSLNSAALFMLRKTTTLNYAVFDISVIVLFTYFIVTGGTEGFSPHWILVLPACSLMFIGKRRGVILSAVMFLIIIAVLWTPIGDSTFVYPYVTEYRMRFPIVYVTFFMIGYFFEFIRGLTQHFLLETQQLLADAAEKDPLTEIHNRRWFNDIITDCYSGKTLRTDGLFIIMDIDDFKKVNDTYGHAVGDRALIYAAKTLTENTRYNDLLCRWGGEEFLLFLPDCDSTSAFSTCERIRAAIPVNQIDAENGKTISITVSIGAVAVKKGEILDSDHVFSIVDECLYQAKSKGKNRVELFGQN